MNRRPQDPLNAEERALAELLGQDAAEQAQPSTALDAAILGAARDATHAEAATQAVKDAAMPAPASTAAAPPRSRIAAHHRQRRRRRWSLGTGTAAAVLLAVTLAWQLRPQPEIAVVREAPRPTTLMMPAPAGAPIAAEETATQTAAAPAPPAAAEGVAEDSPAQAPRPKSETRPRVATQPPRAPAPAPSIQAPAPRPSDIVTPPAPEAMAAPPPPPPAPAPTTPMLDIAAPATLHADGEHQALRRSRANTKASPATRAKMAQEERAQDEGARTQRVMRTDTLVPVADDSLLGREDWIERIRTRYGLGDVLSARRSLQLFVQMHPREPVPDDLQPLLSP
jgi:hypothetical protein